MLAGVGGRGGCFILGFGLKVLVPLLVKQFWFLLRFTFRQQYEMLTLVSVPVCVSRAKETVLY